MDSIKAPKAIDLFSGAGGLSLGLKNAGFEIVAAIEQQEHAVKTYRKNVGDHIHQEDILKFQPIELDRTLKSAGLLSEKEEITLIAGGPPCPPFSQIGRSKISSLIKSGEWHGSDSRHSSVSDSRSMLFLRFVDYVKHFKPKYFLMENVGGMESSRTEQGKEMVSYIRHFFEEIGYYVTVKMLLASDYGVPQNRKRIFFMGSRSDIKPREFPEATSEHDSPILIDVIDDLIEIEPTGDGRVLNSNGNQITCHFSRKINDRDAVLFQFITSGAPATSIGGIDYASSEPKRNYGDVYPDMWNSYLVPAFKKAGLSVWKTKGRDHVGHKNGKSWVMYNPKKFPDKIRRMRWDKPAWTILAHLDRDSYLFIHPFKNRGITVREAARIQSFPDDFEFVGKVSQQFRQVGNAVPPLLAESLGREIYQGWKREILLKRMGG